MSLVRYATINDEEEIVGEKVIRYSDLSGKEIEDPKQEAVATIEFADKRRGKYRLDLTEDEAKEFADKGKKVTEQ